MGTVDFTDRVVITCLPEAPEAERFAAWITDVTQGQAVIANGESSYILKESRHSLLEEKKFFHRKWWGSFFFL